MGNEDLGMTSSEQGSSTATASRSEDPCSVLDGRCMDFDDVFWTLEMADGFDEALIIACGRFGITIAQGKAILAEHDSENNGNF